MSISRVFVNGVGIFPFPTMKDLLDYAKEHRGILVAINAEKILQATDETRAIINRNIGYSDGAGTVLVLKKHGYQAEKLPGCELWLRIIESTYKTGTSFYLVGGKQAVIDETVKKLKAEFDGINIVNYRNGYIKSETDRDNLICDIVEKAPDVVFVAMGSPKQELLMEKMLEKHPSAIYQGLGGSFDVYSGNVKRAPKWFLDHNLEWAYRIFTDFKRLPRLLNVIRFYINVQLGRF